ncbi:hypothetical protein HOY80DRAFT_1094993 [Tuber brumale]|nr:hypothetical protein HOY80DRAFT_1094993 [Tuber brumale]
MSRCRSIVPSPSPGASMPNALITTPPRFVMSTATSQVQRPGTAPHVWPSVSAGVTTVPSDIHLRLSTYQQYSAQEVSFSGARWAPGAGAQERQVGGLKQEKEEWQVKYNEKQDGEAIGRVEIQHLNETAEANATKETALAQELETVMKDTLVPIFAAVIMKVMYRRAADIPHQDQNAGGQDDRVERICELESRLLQLGYENSEQVAEFANELRQPSPHQDGGGDHFTKTRAPTVEGGDVGFSLVQVPGVEHTAKSLDIYYLRHITNIPINRDIWLR